MNTESWKSPLATLLFKLWHNRFIDRKIHPESLFFSRCAMLLNGQISGILVLSSDILYNERFCRAPKRMAAPRLSMFSFCGRAKVGGSNNRLLRDESFESCLTEQRCSVPCVTFVLFRFLSDLSAANKKVIGRISLALNLRLCV